MRIAFSFSPPLTLLAISLVNSLAITSVAGGHEVTVENAYVPSPPPGSSVAVAYLEVTNRGEKSRRIVSAAGECADGFSIHETVRQHEVARMIPIDALELKPGKTLSFTPMGLHIMLEGPRLLDDSDCLMTLAFADGSQVHFEAEIRRPRSHDPMTSNMPQASHHSHHGDSQ